MNSTLQISPVQQEGIELKVNEVYWITTSHEKQKDYIYEGVVDGKHRFFKDGAMRDSMRRILVVNKNLNVKGKDVLIINDEYQLTGVSKIENAEEYSRLQTLWRSKNAK